MQQYADIYLLQCHSTCFFLPTWSDQDLIRPRWKKVAAPALWPIPEVAVTVFSTPDDGRCDARNM